MKRWKDPIVEEVRKIRKQIEEECDNDFDKLFERARRVGEQYPDRLITKPFERTPYETENQTTRKVAEPSVPLTTSYVEPWLRGPIEGVHLSLMPIAHSLKQVMEDLPPLVEGFTREQLYAAPGGAASIAFHLKHLPGSLDRLYTYARGEKLTGEQFARIKKEKEPDDRSVDEFVREAMNVLERAIQQLKETKPETLHEVRLVGRAGLPSNQLALLYHGAEHCQRHIGAMVATAKFLRASAQ